MDTLETIFNQTSVKSSDGKRRLVFSGLQDLMFVYMSGFVDARKYSFQSWLDAFAPSKKPDGRYEVDLKQWLEKKKFHYTGPVSAPFDPMALPEKAYTETEILKLLTEKILPATMFNPSYAPQLVNDLKAQGRFKDGKFLIDKEAKKNLLAMINQYPSPMRILEVNIDRMKRRKKGDSTLAQEDIQKSTFNVGATAQQIASSRFSQLTGAPEKAKPQTEQPAGISLKDLQKRRSPGKI